MKIDLLRLSQDMDLSDQEVTNLIVLRLPNGEEIKAVVSEEGAGAIVRARVGVAAPKTIQAPPPEPEQEEAHLFGGDDDPYVPVPPAQVFPQVQVPKTKPRVSRDEYGYPIVHTPGGVDPTSLSSSADADEDGVGQI